MSTTRTNAESIKRYEQYGIDKNRYLELKYLARQYDQLRRNEMKLRRGEIDRDEKAKNTAWRQSDRTGNTAIAIVMRSNADKIAAIEDAARACTEGSDSLYKCIMRAVTRGETFERMMVPCGRVQFLRMRRQFFVELDRRV